MEEMDTLMMELMMASNKMWCPTANASFNLIIDRFLTGDNASVMNYLSLMHHFQPFARGLIDTADIAYFLLFIVTFLTLTVRRLDADRLRG